MKDQSLIWAYPPNTSLQFLVSLSVYSVHVLASQENHEFPEDKNFFLHFCCTFRTLNSELGA